MIKSKFIEAKRIFVNHIPFYWIKFPAPKQLDICGKDKIIHGADGCWLESNWTGGNPNNSIILILN